MGPRHIIPMLPFAAILLAPALSAPISALLVYAAGLVSAAIMLMATAVEPRVPYEYENPVRDLFWYQYKRANFALEPNGVFGSELLTDNSVAFNLGKLFGLPGP